MPARRTSPSEPADLAEHLPDGLKPLASVAYNYRWSWLPGGEAVFREINPHRWELAGGNPVKFLSDLWPSTRAHAESDPTLKARVRTFAEQVAADLARPLAPHPSIPGPVAYMCAEYGIHASLPIYSGGLGVLAGDTLKEASDRGLELVALGLLYRRGYHQQRLDTSGRQLEYWLTNDPKSLPMARVSVDGEPLKLSVDIFGRPNVVSGVASRRRAGAAAAHRLRGARERPCSAVVHGAALRGRSGSAPGAVRAARDRRGARPACSRDRAGSLPPERGAPRPRRARDRSAGRRRRSIPDEALARVRERFVFTTHTPVPAGNETYGRDELMEAVPDLPARLGLDEEAFLGLFRTTSGRSTTSWPA